MRELPMFPTYNGYKTIQEAAKALGEVTLSDGDTIFKEIKRESGPGFLYDKAPGEKAPDPKVAVDLLRNYLKDRLEDCDYIMPHSSGYDSRLISSLLRELGVSVTFFCWQPEVASATALLKFMGFKNSPAFVHEPQTNGVIERFFRTLKEECLWLENIQNVDHARQIVGGWLELYNSQWLLERHGYRTPREVREAHQVQFAKVG